MNKTSIVKVKNRKLEDIHNASIVFDVFSMVLHFGTFKNPVYKVRITGTEENLKKWVDSLATKKD
jgi:hypothetical protein